MKTKTLLYAVFFVLFISVVTAYNDYTMELGDYHTSTDSITRSEFKAHSTKYDLCLGDTKIIPVWIKTESSNNFKFDVKGVSWATLSGKSLNLKENQNGVVFITLKPAGEADKYNLLLYINSGGAYAGYVPIQLTVDDCYSISLNTSEERDQVCGCEEAKYEVVVENRGKFKETVKLGLVEAPDFVTLSDKSLEIGPNNKSVFVLTVLPECFDSGAYDIQIISYLESNSKITSTSEIAIDVTPKEDCYKAEIIAPKNIRAGYFGKTVSISVKNLGISKATYTVDVLGLDWIKSDKTTITVNEDQKLNLNININPNEDVAPGIYPFEIKLKTKDLEYSGKSSIVLKKENPLVKAIKFNLVYYLYDVIAGIIILLILIVILIIIRRTKLVKKARIKAETKRKLKKSVKPIFVIIAIIISLGLLIYVIMRYVSEPLKYNSILYDFITNITPFGNSIYYVLIGLGVILFIVVLILLVKKLKKSGRKTTEYKIMGKETKKILSYFYIIGSALIIIAILVFSFIYFKLYDRLSPFISRFKYYILTGFIILAVLIVVLSLLKPGKTSVKKPNKWLAPFLITLAILVVLPALVFIIVYFKLFAVIVDFVLVYYPYIIAGFVVLLILIGILKYKDKLS